jgi:polyribonucleotide 5'-hydroxyl-kinase
MTLPGTASIAPIYTTLASSTPVYPLGSSHSTGLAPLHDVPHTLPQPIAFALAPNLNPLSFWIGHADWPSTSSKLASSKVSEITSSILRQAGEWCSKKMERPGEEALWKGGILIDTPADWADVKSKSDTILLAVREFEGGLLAPLQSARLVCNVALS